MAKYRKSLLDIIHKEDGIITQIEALDEEIAETRSRIRDIEYNKAEYSHRLDRLKEICDEKMTNRNRLETDLAQIRNEMRQYLEGIGANRITLDTTSIATVATDVKVTADNHGPRGHC